MNQKINLLDLSFNQLVEYTGDLGLPSYRAQQIWEWLYSKFATKFEDMTNLPKSLRVQLDQNAEIPILEPIVDLHSNDGQTQKVLFQLADDEHIETVLMRYDKRRTLCISTQIGCAMGCVFCATGQMGFFRNLSAATIINQVLYFARQLNKEGERVTNIVFMGMGEPLHNYENSMTAIDTLTNSKGFNLGARKITISTVGLVPAILRFADEKRQISLAISLHAATNEERNKLIPINKRWDIAELMDACRHYIGKTGRRLTFEWALINGENDTVEQAQLLGSLLKGMLCHVNLIPLNPTTGYGGRPSSRERVAAFQHELSSYGVASTVRVRRGIDIAAGCGQLRNRVIEGK